MSIVLKKIYEREIPEIPFANVQFQQASPNNVERQRKTEGDEGIPLHGITPEINGNACLDRPIKDESCRSSETAAPQQQVIAVSAEPKSQ